MGERPICSLLPCMYHLFALKYHFVVDFLCGMGALVSFLLGSVSLFPIGKRQKWSFFFLFLEGHWSLNPLEGFSCKSFFRNYLE